MLRFQRALVVRQLFTPAMPDNRRCTSKEEASPIYLVEAVYRSE